MLPEGRPEVVDPPRGPGEEGEDGRHGHLAGPLVLELHQVPPRRVLLVPEDVGDAVDRPARDFARPAAGEHFGLGEGRGPPRHHLVDLRPVREPPRDRPVAVGGRKLRPPHRLREALEHPVVRARDGHPFPVLGRVVAVGDHVHRVRAHPLPHVAVVGVGDGHLVEVAEDRLVERDVDVLARAGPLRRPQRHQHAEGAVGPREVVAEGRRARHEGRPARLAREVAEPAEGVGDPGEPRVARLGAGLPEPGDADHHELRVHLAQVLPPDPPPLQGPGAEVLDEHVGLGDEPLQEVGAGRLPEVEGDRLLVPRLLEPDEAVAGVARARGPEAAERVADPRLLDLDDLRPELREEGAAEGRGEEGRDVEDPHPVHRAGRPAAPVSPWLRLHVLPASPPVRRPHPSAAATGLLKTPIPVISTSTRSPGRRAGDLPSVPIHTTSPGYRVR